MNALRATGILLLGILGGGCAMVGAQSPVVIGLEPGKQCTQKGTVVATGPSKDAVKENMKERAASIGCNFVQLQSVREAEDGFKADGVAYACR